MMPEPSETGKQKYEGYPAGKDGFGRPCEESKPGFYEDLPCTCKPDCPSNCKGQCGCEACSAAYGDFLSLE
jgi:hypothetical protein